MWSARVSPEAAYGNDDLQQRLRESTLKCPIGFKRSGIISLLALVFVAIPILLCQLRSKYSSSFTGSGYRVFQDFGRLSSIFISATAMKSWFCLFIFQSLHYRKILRKHFQLCTTLCFCLRHTYWMINSWFPTENWYLEVFIELLFRENRIFSSSFVSLFSAIMCQP